MAYKFYHLPLTNAFNLKSIFIYPYAEIYMSCLSPSKKSKFYLIIRTLKKWIPILETVIRKDYHNIKILIKLTN